MFATFLLSLALAYSVNIYSHEPSSSLFHHSVKVDRNVSVMMR